MPKDDNHPAAQCHHSASDLCHVSGQLMAFCLNQALRHQKYQQCRFKSTVVLCFERKSPFIIVVITNFLQNGKPHIYCHGQRVSLLPKILATKRERKADLLLRGWKSESGEIVGHLPKEISRVTKYFLDLGASMYCKLSSKHYQRRKKHQKVL